MTFLEEVFAMMLLEKLLLNPIAFVILVLVIVERSDRNTIEYRVKKIWLCYTKVLLINDDCHNLTCC